MSNNNRENNKGGLEELLEIFFVGCIYLIGEILVEIAKKIFDYILAIIIIAFVMYLLVTFLINHV